MHWKCLFVFQNTCKLKQTTLGFLAVIFASIVFVCTMCISMFLPVCVYDAGIKEQRFNLEMLEDPFISQFPSPRDSTQETLVERLRKNISKLSRELDQLRATVNIYEKLGKVIEKDSSLVTFGSKRHQNVLLTAVPNSGEIFLGDMFNQHRDVFYLFEPFHALKYFRENRPPEVYASMLSGFLQGIFSCDFHNFKFYTEFLSRHYRALVHRLASRILSSPPLCPEVVYGRYYNIRFCTHLRPPTLTAICKLHAHTVIKTTQLVDLERLAELNDGTRYPLRVVELVRDPRAILYTHLHEGLEDNVTELWVANEARKICTQQLRNRKYVQNSVLQQTERYILVKYENLISKPLEVVANLSRFLGFSSSRHVTLWLKGVFKDGFAWLTAVKEDEIGNSERKKINLTQSVSDWQSNLDLWQIRSIERECFAAMKLLGYGLHNDSTKGMWLE